MTNRQDLLQALQQRREAAYAMGGPEKIERQHRKGKLTVRERVDRLLDPGSFQEYGLLASHVGHRPGDAITPADAVVTGVGRINGRPVCLCAEDATVMGGSVDEINGEKRVRMISLANSRLLFIAPRQRHCLRSRQRIGRS